MFRCIHSITGSDYFAPPREQMLEAPPGSTSGKADLLDTACLIGYSCLIGFPLRPEPSDSTGSAVSPGR